MTHEDSRTKTKSVAIRTVVESKENAVLLAERLEIPVSAKQRLSTTVSQLDPAASRDRLQGCGSYRELDAGWAMIWLGLSAGVWLGGWWLWRHLAGA